MALAQGDHILPIPVTAHLKEDAATIDVQLSDADVDRLSEAFNSSVVAGERMPPYAMEKPQK